MVGFEGKYGGCRGGGVSFQLRNCGGSLSFLRNLPRLFSNIFYKDRVATLHYINCCLRLCYGLNRLVEKTLDTNRLLINTSCCLKRGSSTYPTSSLHNYNNGEPGETLKTHVAPRRPRTEPSIKHQLTILGGLLQILRPTHSKSIPRRRLHISSRLLAMGQT